MTRWWGLAGWLALQWAVLLGALVGVGSLLPDVGVPHVDAPVDTFLREHRSAALTSTMRAVTAVGSPGWVLTAVAVVAIWLALVRRPLDALVLIVVVLGADVGQQVGKAVVGRARPAGALQVPHVGAGGSAFPSGHATVAAAGIGVITLLAASSVSGAAVRTTILVVGGVAAALAGLSRLYLGVHWPTDVLGGWLLSVAWMYLVVRAVRRLRPA